MIFEIDRILTGKLTSNHKYRRKIESMLQRIDDLVSNAAILKEDKLR